MRLENVPPCVHAAAALTVGPLVEGPRVGGPPSWDGRTLRVGRIQRAEHVVHEIAHWIVAPRLARSVPNFGLGTDPDNGPATPPDLAHYLTLPDVGEMIRSEFAAGSLLSEPRAVLDRILDREECIASMITVLLLRVLGLAWSRHAHRFRRSPHVWSYVHAASRRGVDLTDPLAPYRKTTA